MTIYILVLVTYSNSRRQQKNIATAYDSESLKAPTPKGKQGVVRLHFYEEGSKEASEMNISMETHYWVQELEITDADEHVEDGDLSWVHDTIKQLEQQSKNLWTNTLEGFAQELKRIERNHDQDIMRINGRIQNHSEVLHNHADNHALTEKELKKFKHKFKRAFHTMTLLKDRLVTVTKHVRNLITPR